MAMPLSAVKTNLSLSPLISLNAHTLLMLDVGVGPPWDPIYISPKFLHVLLV